MSNSVKQRLAEMVIEPIVRLAKRAYNYSFATSLIDSGIGVPWV